MDISNQPYYMAYENRYKLVYAAGANRWGHAPDDLELTKVLIQWVSDHQLLGKQIIEFACGEGASGVILANLGCSYLGLDIAPSAIEKASNLLKDYKNVKVILGDMVNQQITGKYDAAIDIMGLHMLVTDSDRQKYLRNAYECLKKGAPMLFFRESYRVYAYDGKVNSFKHWLTITEDDYKTPRKSFVHNDNKKIEVNVPLVPGRARTREGYLRELTEIGFIVDLIQEMESSYKITNSATIYVHKP